MSPSQAAARIQWLLLGYAASVATPQVWPTHFALRTHAGLMLIDLPGDPHLHLPRFGLDPARAEHLVLTHFHPDHVSGLPLFLQNLALRGRRRPLHVHGPAATLQRAQAWLRALDWEPWPWAYAIQWHAPAVGRTPTLLLEWGSVRVFAATMQHVVPTWGLRVEGPSGRAVAYSADTEPNPALDALARDAAWLFHEATGPYPGHSTPAQAGQTARRAHAQRLYLVHLDPMTAAESVAQARAAFAGPVEVPQPGQSWTL